ncbi:unnamed protein product [Phytophthora fragariaefolia]|uniref:Unnamed protein product n=1 Tax=Phytophthora fragariaefolia TaxID=1490495 RepID=A0A9W6U0A2_9STRA|nr:unnamed protein product [Phytophthora fragariaefolia]
MSACTNPRVVFDSPGTRLESISHFSISSAVHRPPRYRSSQALKAMNCKGLIAVALVALVGMANAEADDHVARQLQVADFSNKLLNAVNAKRAEKGLKVVCINTKLAKAAQVLANDNAKNNKVGTRGSDGSTPTSRYTAQNIKTSQSAELAGAGQASADAVVATWIKSSSAYLYSDFKFIGPGYAYDASKVYKHYWVLDLANANGETCA